MTTAQERLAALIGNAEVIETDRHAYDGGAIVVASLVGDPESDGDEYYADDVAVAWDASLDRDGESGACFVAAGELSTWLSLRWPCTIGGPGFARDGSWYEDGRQAVGQ